jgi:caa(3)-type oxidase subunit IV
MAAKTFSWKMYAWVLVGLFAGLVLNLGIAYLDVGGFRPAIAVAISAGQALLVILFFMHVGHANRVLWLFVAAGFFWLAILLVLAMSDYLSRRWDLGL